MNHMIMTLKLRSSICVSSSTCDRDRLKGQTSFHLKILDTSHWDIENSRDDAWPSRGSANLLYPAQAVIQPLYYTVVCNGYSMLCLARQACCDRFPFHLSFSV